MTDDTNPEKNATQPGGLHSVQAKMDAIAEQGYEGTGPDTTPLENYTVAGVIAGKPVPDVHRGNR